MPSSFALIDRLGCRLIQLGLLLTGIGMGLLAAMVAGHHHVATWSLIPGTTLAGAGMGFVFGQLFDVVLTGITGPEAGSASGVLNTTQQLSFAIGVAGVATLFLAELPHHPAGDALAITALATLAPLTIALALTLRLPPAAQPEP